MGSEKTTRPDPGFVRSPVPSEPHKAQSHQASEPPIASSIKPEERSPLHQPGVLTTVLGGATPSHDPSLLQNEHPQEESPHIQPGGLTTVFGERSPSLQVARLSSDSPQKTGENQQGVETDTALERAEPHDIARRHRPAPPPPPGPKGRELNDREIAYAEVIFADSIDYTAVWLTRDRDFSWGASKVIGNTIHLRSEENRKENFKSDGTLTTAGLELLVHELTHVWQFQNGDWTYAPDSLLAQFAAWVNTGNRNNAYDWESAYNAELPWENWNPEQQAAAVEDYNAALRRKWTAGVEPEPDDEKILRDLAPFIGKVQRGEGAPTFDNWLDGFPPPSEWPSFP